MNRISHLGDALSEQIGIKLRCVQLLQRANGALLRVHVLLVLLLRVDAPGVLARVHDLLHRALEVCMAAPKSLGVDHTEAALLAQLDDELGAGQSIRRVRGERDVECVGVDVPARVHVLRRTGAALRHD